MLPCQPTRSAREPGAELNTVVSSQECHPAVMIRSDSTGVGRIPDFPEQCVGKDGL